MQQSLFLICQIINKLLNSYVTNFVSSYQSTPVEICETNNFLRFGLFRSVNGFLTPYPGALVAGHTSKTFDGNLSGFFHLFSMQFACFLSDVSTDFLAQIRVLVTTLLSPANRSHSLTSKRRLSSNSYPNIAAKMIDDSFVTGKSLFELFKVCVKFEGQLKYSILIEN